MHLNKHCVKRLNKIREKQLEDDRNARDKNSKTKSVVRSHRSQKSIIASSTHSGMSLEKEIIATKGAIEDAELKRKLAELEALSELKEAEQAVELAVQQRQSWWE